MSGTIRFQFMLTLIMFVTGLSSQSAFVTTWQTDMPGSSCNSCITIPTEGPGYSYNVDWDNDGSFDQSGITGDVTHDFGAPGTYTIRIIGSFPRIYFNGSGDAQKLVSIDQWGSGLWSGMEKAFSGCINMESNASDSPNLNFVGSTAWMFENCLLFNGDVTGWDVSQVNDMTGMFSGAASFDQNLGNWLLKSNVILLNFLDFTGISCENYDNTLMGWYNNPQTPLAVTLGAAGVHFWLSIHARAYMLMPLCSGGMGWDIFGDSYQECDYFVPFVTKWNTANGGSSCQSCITIPTAGGGYSYDVDWNNDGIYDQLGVTGGANHNFGSPGEYTIRIRGDFPRIFFNDQGDKEKLLSVDQWGSIEWSSMEKAFMGCSNLEILALDVPDLSTVSSMSGMFEGCASMNQDLSEWNVGNVSDMSRLFAGATAFDQFIGSWDVSDVVNMKGMFAGAAVFNQSLSSWNVSKVINMSEMFANAQSFNQQISAWNVSQVTNMSDMFSGAIAFDGNIGNWTLNQQVNLEGMLDDSGMSCQNYDNTLIGWLSKNTTPENRNFGAQGVHFWLASTERNQLIEQKGWSFNGDSQGDCDYILPVCTSYSFPEEGSTDVYVDAGITWASTSLARGYKLSLGTTPGGTDILNNLDLGNVNHYQPEDFLPCGETIFARVTPYNLKGSAGNCPELSFNTESVNLIVSGSADICEGEAVELAASGATTYFWSPSEGLSNTMIAYPVAAPEVSTNYTVTASNEGRCTVQANIQIGVNPKPSLNIVSTDETGHQFNDGTIVSTPATGNGPFTYNWSNGASDAELTNLAPGVYFVTVTDSNGCIAVDSSEIQAFICPVLNVIVEQEHVSCYEQCDGTLAIISVENAIAPLEFTWFDGSTDPVKSGLCAGTFGLSVKDAKHCLIETSFEVIQPDEMVILVDGLGNETGEQNGFIEISLENHENIDILWTGPNGFSSGDEDIYGLAAGCYTLEISDTLSNCRANKTICIEKLTGSQDIEMAAKDVLVFPNPARTQIFIKTPELWNERASVRMYSLEGKLILDETQGNPGSIMEINISGIDRGLYLLSVEGSNGIYRQKVEVIR